MKDLFIQFVYYIEKENRFQQFRDKKLTAKDLVNNFIDTKQSFAFLLASLETMEHFGFFGQLWQKEDVYKKAKELDLILNEDEVIQVIRWIQFHKDANIGVTWDTIEEAITIIKQN